jgi:hypothetical protein
MAKIIKTEKPTDSPLHVLAGRFRHTIEFNCTRCKKLSTLVIWGTEKFAEAWEGTCEKCEDKE